ncbi:hypothetical protein BGZ61DRAFT_441168 [Ilyonectria robusta]|uniref:uncharacterized protein n=1 Tax=Ilyonectria robusta TaxID=1079257 RepID=UPI001E8D228C|nr:uncharacterized protein BGZ61DRAFT_441168 [Ilyonectria robusta]KAH8735905.1 hypothetical protein BGZ61DRAFT_441168 [Ilyonectria robusta]
MPVWLPTHADDASRQTKSSHRITSYTTRDAEFAPGSLDKLMQPFSFRGFFSFLPPCLTLRGWLNTATLVSTLRPKCVGQKGMESGHRQRAATTSLFAIVGRQAETVPGYNVSLRQMLQSERLYLPSAYAYLAGVGMFRVQLLNLPFFVLTCSPLGWWPIARQSRGLFAGGKPWLSNFRLLSARDLSQ